MSSQDEMLELSTISSIHSSIHDVKQTLPTPRSPGFLESTSNAATTVSEDAGFMRSDAHSYRNRLKERFNFLKEQAVKSTSADFRVASQKVSLLTTSVKLLQRENECLEAELKSGNRIREGRGDDFEEYVFFCEEEHKQSEEAEDEEGNEWKGSRLFKFQPAEQLCYFVELREKELLWQPNRNPGILVTTTTMEEEGLFVGNKPKISKADLILLQHRLGTDEQIKWFDRDGFLNTLQSPHVNFSIRPSTKQLQLTEYCPAISKHSAPCEEVVVHENTILDLQISKLTFKHHPLFSAEHVLQQKLIDFYDTYQQISSKNMLQRMLSRLEALRNAKERSEKQGGDAVNADLSKEIAKLRDRLFEEGKEERIALKGILQTWKAIKVLRESNGYSNTSIKLTIRKENTDYSYENEIYERQIKETTTEVIQERSKEFQEKMRTYKEELHIWRSAQNENLQKPKKPLKNFDENDIKQEISQKFRESFKAPGEPKLYFEISHDNQITVDVQDPKEKLRRNSVKTTSVWLKIFCNNIEVCKTKHVLLNERFTCVFDESYSIRLNSDMGHILVEIVEQPGALLNKKVAELILPVTNENRENRLCEEHFAREEIIHYNKHGGVGSGIAFSKVFPDFNLPDTVLNTSGVLLYTCSWDFLEEKRNELRRGSDWDCFEDIFDKYGMIDNEKLVKWTKNMNLDPEDPKNAVVYDYVKNYAENAITSNSSQLFRLNPQQRCLIFCDHTEIERNIRFIVLQHRNNNVAEFSGMIVPNRLKEIPFNVLHSYLQRLNDLRHDFEYKTDDNVEVKRSDGRKFLKQVFMNIFQQCRNSEDNVCFEDIVDEKFLAHFDLLIQTFIGKLASLFSFQPKVDTFREPALAIKQVEVEENKIQNAAVKIIVNLQSGLNIPCRNNDGDSVKPFIVVECDGIEVVSSSVEGTNCSWNEELILPLETTHTDYLNPDSLNGFVTVRLFDNLSTETKSAVCLGYTDIPISAICNSQMEGFFKIKTPDMLTNYVQYHDKLLSGSTASNIQHLSPQETYLLMKIYSHPSLPKLSPSMDEWPSNESPYMKNYITRWNSSYNIRYPSRKFSALFIDTNGRSSCITRYIRPLEPPQLNPEGYDVTPEQCARYISMIPFTESNKFYENVCLTTNELLKLMVGSVLDHAIGLTCYLLSLNVETWLLLGFGIPHGSTAYVLMREYIKEVAAPVHYIFDVLSGTKYSLLDIYCPLQRIFCVINEHNVWANLQRTDRISNVRFDLSRRLDWSSLFDNNTQAPTCTIQTKLNYYYEDHVQDLEVKIDKKIKRKVMKLRRLNRTVWNHTVAKTYKHVMRKLEFNALNGKSSREVYLEVNRALGALEVDGYVFNSSYTKVSSMVKYVLNNVRHLIEVDSIEFASVVYVHPYPACIYSVWILFVTVAKNN